jgi:VanZ family protein
LWASTTPEPPGKSLFDLPMADKAVHFCGYALLCWLVAMSMRRAQHSYQTLTLLLAPVLFATLYGILNEIIQTFVAARSYEIGDIVANTLGAVAVQAAYAYARSRKRATNA